MLMGDTFSAPNICKRFVESDSTSHVFKGFDAFTAVKIQVEVFCVVTQCNVMVGYHHFRGPSCLHLQSEVDRAEWTSETLAVVLPQHYTASQPRRPRLLWVFKLETSKHKTKCMLTFLCACHF